MWSPDISSLPKTSMAHFVDFINAKYTLEIRLDDYQALHEWSIADVGRFWSDFAEFMGFDLHVPQAEVLVGGSLEASRWFPQANINYAEIALRESQTRSESDVAVISISENGQRETLTLGQLRDLVARVRAGMQDVGVGKDDVVAGLISNSVEALAAFLASASLGAVWSACSPEFGEQALLDRFTQLNPKLLIAMESYVYGGKTYDISGKIGTLIKSLPRLKGTVVIGSGPDSGIPNVQSWIDFIKLYRPLEFESVEFSHPLWVLFSSGTTGKPKGIVHGHGGIVLEHVKNLRLHHDLGSSSKFFWFTTTGWMMWNYLVSGLLVEATIIVYDGSPGWPDLSRLWRLAAEEGVSLFGVSAPFIHATMKEGVNLSTLAPMPNLKSIGSTGAPLSPDAFEWISEQLGSQIQICSTSGGTDVCSAFLISAPNVPVWKGELSCAALGVDARSFDEHGLAILDQVGELVLIQAMPSMPIKLWGDADGSKYRETYFSHYPGIWRHGDWCTHTSHGSFVIVGRSDATLNRGGIRSGTADFYRVIERVVGVKDSLVVDIAKPNSSEDGNLWLFISVEGDSDHDIIVQRIRAAIRMELSPRHVPDEIRFVQSIPKTLNGKKCEVPVKKILLGAKPKEVMNLESLQDPNSLEPFVLFHHQI